MLVLLSTIAASRKVVAARLTTLRAQELSSRCPLILLLGLNPSQETKALPNRPRAEITQNISGSCSPIRHIWSATSIVRDGASRTVTV